MKMVKWVWEKVRKFAPWFGLGFSVVLIAAWLIPVNNIYNKLAILGSLFGIWAMLLIWLWRKWIAFASAVAVPVGVLTVIFTATELPDSVILHRLYMQELRKFEGTRYVWGGENFLGIDCSGLPRAALRKAWLRSGYPAAWRLMIKQWWSDASARALASGCKGYAVPLNISGTVASAPVYSLQPGDLAISANGRHVMVYLAPGEWISADPDAGKVIIEPPCSKNWWFDKPVNFYRWREL